MIRRLLSALALVTALFAMTPAMAAGANRAQLDIAIAEAKAAMLTNPHDAIGKARQAATLAAQLGGNDRIEGIATAQWLEAEANLRLDNPKTAAPLIASALGQLANSPASKLKGDLMVTRGGYHTATNEIAKALADYQAAFTLYHAVNEPRGEAIALTTIGGLYTDANDFQSALKYYGQAIDAYQGDPQLLMSIYNNRGGALRLLNRYAAAEADYGKALAIAQKMKSPALVAQILRNIARAQLNAGALVRADHTIADGFAALREAKDDGSAAGQMWALSAQSALQRGDLAAARERIEQAFGRLDIKEQSTALWMANKTAFEIYRALGDSKPALEHLEAMKAIDDSNTKLATSTNTALMAARFDFANQELRIAQLKADEAQRRQRTQFWIFTAGGVTAAIVVTMLAVGLVTIRRSRNEVRAANVDLAQTNAALAKALAAKTEFLATTSHEIRTPLNGILGMTQVMLADGRLDPQVRDRIGVVHGAGVSMRALVDDILDVAKMETGNLTIEQAPVELPALLRDVSRLWEEQARGKGVGFALEIAEAPAWIESDPARLRQVVFNLLSNALKFTDRGTVSVAARALDGQGGGETLEIVIRDTGIGIPSEKLELIFESFRQADAGTTRRFGGTGLGLAICRNIARAMGGDVTVASVTGEGSTFTLSLPLVRVAGIAAAHAAGNGEALLIVERNPINRAMLKTLFGQRVATVQAVGSVAEAEAAIAAGGIARVVADEATVKGEPDPVAALARLAGPSIALLWTAPTDEDRERFASLGIETLVAKPISGTDLVAAVVSEPVSFEEGLASVAA